MVAFFQTGAFIHNVEQYSTTHFSDMAHCYILVRVDIPEGEDPLAVIQDCELSISVDDEDDNTLFLNTEIKHVYDQNENLLF